MKVKKKILSFIAMLIVYNLVFIVHFLITKSTNFIFSFVSSIGAIVVFTLLYLWDKKEQSKNKNTLSWMKWPKKLDFLRRLKSSFFDSS